MPPVTLPPDTPAVVLLDRFAAMLMLARALAAARRPLDLGGLDDIAGRLVAACLDLPPERGRALRARLLGLLTDIDALAAICRSSRCEDGTP